ncbi:MAG TPA: mannose-1-phosphate guanylyltransferase [Anaerolineae bacterium]|nr:mannose-1-phosphate guanylyltransferase [Anaerolineae bacterium]
MAGGGGTRLWPLSRKKRPKQMLKLGNEYSLFQLAVDRLKGSFLPEQIYIVTVAEQVEILQKQTPQIPIRNFLIEPIPRGTASVVGYAASVLKTKDSQATMAVLTSDQIIENTSLFLELLDNAYQIAQEQYLVTLGIEPDYPATGYGYIQRGASLSIGDNICAFQVSRFVEKPNEERAKEYLNSGQYFWNSGMFIWRADCILDEFKRQMPSLSNSLELIAQYIGKDDFGKYLDDIWPKINPQTVDYGIMENALRVAVLPAKGLGWSDVGSWDSLFGFLDVDFDGNVIMSEKYISFEMKNCLIKSDNPRKLIVPVGVRDLIIVDTEDALLICPRGQSQKVRQVVNMINKNFWGKYL